MNKRNKKRTALQELKEIKGLKYKVIFAIIIIASLLVLFMLTISIIGSKSQDIIDAYNTMSDKPFNSKGQFEQKFIYIARNSDGSYSISFVIGGKSQDSTPDGITDSDPGTPDGGTTDLNNPSIPNNPNNSSTPSDPSDPLAPVGPLTGDTATVINFFIAKGYSRNCAIGIAANLQAESGFDITAKNGKGYRGLAQWDSGRWSCYQKYLAQGHSDSLQSQLEFVYMEMNGIAPASPQYPNVLSVNNFKDKGKYYATKMVAKWFERCGHKINGYKIYMQDDNSYDDQTFISSCQGGDKRLNNAKGMS